MRFTGSRQGNGSYPLWQGKGEIMNDIKKGELLLAVGSLCALIWFYTLMAFGNQIPPGINGFWAPVAWFFGKEAVGQVVGYIKEKQNVASKKQ